MTKGQAYDLAFDKAMDYMNSIDNRLSQREQSLIARAIGNFQLQFEKLEGEIK